MAENFSKMYLVSEEIYNKCMKVKVKQRQQQHHVIKDIQRNKIINKIRAPRQWIKL